jgi:Flp pilus assembly protein TadG
MRLRCVREDKGQSLIETALLLPLMLTLVFNAVNIGYFFYVALNLTTAPRQGAEYSIQGMSSAVEIELPGADPVHTLVNEGITGAISSAASTPMQVCSLSIGTAGSGASQTSMCNQYNGYPATTPDADPEAPALVLNRFDIQYTVAPLISGRAFNILLPPSLAFHRQVTMRAMP